ncbi:MAG: Asp-tRNA(Asn)/Glu-tRNA(Gln) amidotransferase subunit GatC [Deltaproteobacteria bacterium]|nr:Asp-tRNA(Asn)/Glu-tRNA(Gln) amidotransferase subunit GatC [Deltaproteobacteria bacterium]
MKITRDEVKYVSHLARLNFGEEEAEKFTSQLNDILVYMDILNKVETSGIKPTTHAIDLTNAFREDTVKESTGTEVALANAPDRSGDCFRVPKVIE